MQDGAPSPELDIVPEPLSRDRAAIARALERATSLPRGDDGRSAWWREGVRESLAPSATSSGRART